MRVTGAQGLARMGLDLWAIQLIGRWGSETVTEYIRAIPLERAVAWAARAARNWELPRLVNEVAPRRPQRRLNLRRGLLLHRPSRPKKISAVQPEW